MERISLPTTLVRKKPTLHSAAHLLADDLSKEMREPDRFGAYLGIARRYHESDLRALARRIREKEDLPADARGKYFFAVLRTLPSRRITHKKKKASKQKKTIVKKSHAKRKSGRAAHNRQRTA